MVQKLNIILITSPELADFRRRLKSLETRVCVMYCLCLNLELTAHSKMVKRCSRHYTGHGVIMQSLCSLYVFLHKHTNTLPTYYIYCMLKIFFRGRLVLMLP